MKKFSEYTILGLLIGLIFGLAIAFYLNLVTLAENLRMNYYWFILFLPIVGVFFLKKYDKYQIHNDRVVDVQINYIVSLKRLIITCLGTILSHLAGASIGRENTAARMTEDISEILADTCHLSKDFLNQLYIVAMATGLAGTFGVVGAAIVLPFEVIPRKKWRFSTFYLTFLTSWITVLVGEKLNIKYPKFHLTGEVIFSFKIIAICGLVIILSLLLGNLFRFSIRFWRKLRKKLKISANMWLVISSLIIFILIDYLHSTEYLGISSNLQTASVTGDVSLDAFIWKWLFTMLCLGSRFQGGMLTPAIDISMCAGASLAFFCQIDGSFLVALMLVGVFTVLSRAPLTSVMVGITFFGFYYIFYFLLVAYMVNLLATQKTIFRFKEIK